MTEGNTLVMTTYGTYIDEADRQKWNAVIENSSELEVTFTGLDNCIENVTKQRFIYLLNK